MTYLGLAQFDRQCLPFARWLAVLAPVLSVVVLSVAVLLPATAAEGATRSPGPFAGSTLEQALLRLADTGLPLVFTDRVVSPEMRVEREPTAD